ncbi:MAG TPA: CARDB domain-containing protein [Dehalococcoidales bacterium]
MVHRTLVRKLVNLALPCVILLSILLLGIAKVQAQSCYKLTVIPSSGIPGSNVTIKGTGFTPSPTISMYPETICTATITMDMNVIATNVMVDLDGTFSVSAVVPDLPPGKKTVTARSCEESALTSFDALAHAPAPLKEPDLAISSTDYWFENDGEVLVLSLGIKNLGYVRTPETLVWVEDQDHELPDRLSTVPGLNPGEMTPMEIRHELVKEQRGKTHMFLFEVDPDNAVNETNEENNHQSMDVLIPAQGDEVPWQWIVPALLAGGVAFSLERWFHKRRVNVMKKIQVRPQRDIGTQQIESDSPILLDYEIRLRPVLDRGKQDIEAKGPLIIDKRRRG